MIIDIPDCYIDVVKGLMLMRVSDGQEIRKVETAADLFKQAADPIVIDLMDAGVFNEDKKTCRQMLLAVGAFAFVQIIKNIDF